MIRKLPPEQAALIKRAFAAAGDEDLGTRVMTIKMRGVMDVTEYKGRWLKGKLTSDPSVSLEISFEIVAGSTPFPGTHISYIGAWRARQVLIEYQLGVMCRAPDQSSWDALRPVIDRLIGYRPMTFASD